MELGWIVAAGDSVALGTTIVVVLIATAITGPQAANMIDQARTKVSFIIRSNLRSNHSQLARHVAYAIYAVSGDHHVIFDPHSVALRQIYPGFHRVSHALF
jgi:hypothetical protein